MPFGLGEYCGLAGIFGKTKRALDREKKRHWGGPAAGTARQSALRGAASDVMALAAWAIILAFIMSTQFIAQPFVWRNWDLNAIIPAWESVLRDRMVVALCIALLLATAGVLAPRGRGARLLSQALAIIIGAVLGEAILRQIGSPDVASDLMAFGGRIIRWAIVGGSISLVIFFWRSGSELSAETEEARIEEARLRTAAASSKLETLKRQIEPHFLFNTLATIRSLQETDRSRSQHLLGRLLDFMSATLGDRSTGPVTLETEIALVLAYLDVCAARMSGRLVVRCDVPPEYRQTEMPPLVLATLAENAVKHGIFPQDGGEIVISAVAAAKGMIDIAIADDGVGFSENNGGSGIGLANIGERLRLLYGPMAILRLEMNVPRGVRAIVRIPIRPVT